MQIGQQQVIFFDNALYIIAIEKNFCVPTNKALFLWDTEIVLSHKTTHSDGLQLTAAELQKSKAPKTIL